MAQPQPPRLGDVFPNFEADTTAGKIKFHDWLGDSWGILFSHPKDFTPVCTTELGEVAKLMPEFEKRGVKIIAVSFDSVEDHKNWSKDVMCYAKLDGELPYPIIADPNKELGTNLGMIDPAEKDSTGMPLTARAVFVVGPDKKMKLSILYPATTGRNFVEILRVIDSLQLTARKKVATPVNWTNGAAAMVVPSLSKEEAKEMFKDVEVTEVPSGKEYIRMTKDYQ